MTKPLDDAARRLRSLTPGQLADAVGAAKAAIADANDVIAGLKEEAIRRGLTEANGAMFRITLSPPGEATRLDKDALEAAFGAEAVRELYSKTVPTDWVIRCSARIQKAARVAA